MPHFDLARYGMMCRKRSGTLPAMKFLHRLGPDPHANGAKTSAGSGCPDIIALADGDFAVIGVDITELARGNLPPTVSCGADERVVRIPRKTLVLAKPDIPTA